MSNQHDGSDDAGDVFDRTRDRAARALARALAQIVAAERIPPAALAGAALEFGLSTLIADLGPERAASVLAGFVETIREQQRHAARMMH